MPAAIDGVLNQYHRDSLEIDNFIFHIIDPDAVNEEDKVLFLDEVQLTTRQQDFFLDRLKESSVGTQYSFLENAVHLKEKCLQVVQEPDRFIELSRQITADFSGRHEGNMSAGVFVVATVKYKVAEGNVQKLIFLVKMDKRPSFTYSYEVIEGKKIASMVENENSLNETKASIQKSALIDVSDNFAWDVLAFDRIKTPLIAEYYRAFLGVIERQQDSALTRSAHAIVKRWAKELPVESMAPGEDVLSYVGRALNYLQDHTAFDTDEYLDAVVRDEDIERKTILTNSLRERLEAGGVAGQTFIPRPDSIKGKDKKQIYETSEGVTIVFEGDKSTVGLHIEDLGENKHRFIIETDGYKIKS